MQDQVIPGYKELSKQGVILPVNECFIDERYYQCTPCVRRSTFVEQYRESKAPTGRKVTVDRDLHPFIGFDYPEMDYQLQTWAQNEIGQLLKEAIADAKSAEMDLLTSLAEARKTYEYIRDRSRSAALMLSKVRKTAKKFARSRTDFDSLILEWNFAVTPIMLDIESAKKALEELSTRVVKGRAMRTKEMTVEVPTNYASGLKSIDIIHEVKVRAGCYYRVNAGSASFGANPLATVWETIPYSWLIDYFVDVGESLQALGTQIGHHTAANRNLWSSIRYEAKVANPRPLDDTFRECYLGSECGYSYGKTTTVYSRGTRDQRRIQYKRRRHEESEVNYWPRFEVDLSLGQIANTISVFKGFDRFRKRFLPSLS
jgi:hypothetical protein